MLIMYILFQSIMKARKSSSQKQKKQRNESKLGTNKKKSVEKDLQTVDEYKQPRSSCKEQKKSSKKNRKPQNQQIKANFLPGQRYQTPEEDDGAYAFYKSLYESNPHSQIAQKYCLQHGVLQPQQALILLKSINKASSKKK